MAFDWHAAGVVWVEHTAENAISAGAAAALGAIGSAVTGTIASVPWYGVLSAAGFAALTTVLAALASLRVPNGTASFLPSVVAYPSTPPKAKTPSP